MEENKDITVCFTGHRNIPSKEFLDLNNYIYAVTEKCIENGYKYFLTGGALSFDTLAALTVLSLRNTYKDIKLILVLPCRDQAKLWSEKDAKVYEKIKEQADEIIYTSDRYFTGCMHKRNRYLVDHSCLCICYLKKDTGGTAYTVDYALKSGIEVINLTKKQPSK